MLPWLWRRRKEDIPFLVEHFLKKFSSREKKPVRGIDKKALNALMKYGFPGNVRELENIVERAVILGRHGCADVFLPSVGAKPGVAPAVWYTTVWVHNPNTVSANVTFYLLERQANLAPKSFTDSIPPGDTIRTDDAILAARYAIDIAGRTFAATPHLQLR